VGIIQEVIKIMLFATIYGAKRFTLWRKIFCFVVQSVLNFGSTILFCDKTLFKGKIPF
jgi:hypothetical protein